MSKEVFLFWLFSNVLIMQEKNWIKNYLAVKKKVTKLKEGARIRFAFLIEKHSKNQHVKQF